MKDSINILIIETDPSLLAGLEEKINFLGFKSCRPAGPDKPIDQLEALGPDLTILGPSLDMETSFKCINKLKIIDPIMPILTSNDDSRLLSGSSASPPFEGVHYLSKNLHPDEISEVIESALRHRSECESQPDFPLIVGQSQEIKSIKQKIQKVCSKDITILITGETGTGKELIARSIHYHSQRKKGPLVKINCGALPDELLESEVFGFQRGAFTGAHKDKPGRLEMADGGTLFIDEIGELSLSLQVKPRPGLCAQAKYFGALGNALATPGTDAHGVLPTDTAFSLYLAHTITSTDFCAVIAPSPPARGGPVARRARRR